MANLVTLAQLRTTALRLADLENASTRFSTPEINSYVQMGLGSYYEQLVRSRGDFFQNQVIITTDGISTTFALPSDFLQLQLAQVLLGTQFQGTGDNNIALSSFTMAERPELSSSTPGWSGQPFCYRVHAGLPANPGQTQSTINVQYAIEFLPKPAVNMKVQLFYTPQCPQLINDNDSIDAFGLGWDLYASAYAAKMLRIKDDLPTAAQDAILAELVERIQAVAPHRDAAGPKRVTDQRRRWPQFSWRRRRVS